MDSFECHINVVLRDIVPDAREGRGYAERFAHEHGWKFSCISDEEGEPLDDGVMFLTCHATNLEAIFVKMARTHEVLQRDVWLRPVRRKIERIIFDERDPA